MMPMDYLSLFIGVKLRKLTRNTAKCVFASQITTKSKSNGVENEHTDSDTDSVTLTVTLTEHDS